MLLNVSYNDPAIKRRIEEAVGAPFSLQQRWKMRGIGSQKLNITSSSIDIHNLLILDQNINTFDQSKFYNPNITKSRKLFATIIIEIKIDKENSRLLRSVIKELPFSPKRFSKYCESILPSNRNYVM